MTFWSLEALALRCVPSRLTQPSLSSFAFAGQLEHIHTRTGHRLQVVAAEGAERVVIGMVVGAEVTHGHVAVGGPLDAPAPEEAVGVAVDEQREHQVGRELLVAAALVIDREGRERQPLDGLDDEMDQIILGHPLAQVGRQQHGRVAVDVFEACGHAHL